jgi:hypothetical protein
MDFKNKKKLSRKRLKLLYQYLAFGLVLIAFSTSLTTAINSGGNIHFYKNSGLQVLAQPALPNTPDFGVPSLDSESSQNSVSIESSQSSTTNNQPLPPSTPSTPSFSNSSTTNSVSSSFGSGLSGSLNSSSSISRSVFSTGSRDSVYEIQHNSSSLPPIKDLLPEESARTGGTDWIVGGVGTITLLFIVWYCQKYITGKNQLKSQSMYRKTRK